LFVQLTRFANDAGVPGVGPSTSSTRNSPPQGLYFVYLDGNMVLTSFSPGAAHSAVARMSSVVGFGVPAP
jgi:hypothetical protein